MKIALFTIYISLLLFGSCQDSFFISKKDKKGVSEVYNTNEWPVLRHYDQEHTCKIALPVGGIGTGTVSLGGRGNLQDWEIRNSVAKGFNPNCSFFIFTDIEGRKDTRLLEGPIPFYLYEGQFGTEAANHQYPRFNENTFDAAYPFGQVNLKTPQIPVEVKIKAFNPLIPGDIDNSSIPMVILDFELTNTSDKEISFSICGTLENFLGGKPVNSYREENGIKGLSFTSEGIDPNSPVWGDVALITASQGEVFWQTSWLSPKLGNHLLDFWYDFSDDGILRNRKDAPDNPPIASLGLKNILPAKGRKTVRFMLTWYFPNRKAWSSEMMKNYYATQYNDAWDVVSKTLPKLDSLESKTKKFVGAFCRSNLPDVVKEAALFNISTLRTETCFRLSDGNFFAYEGAGGWNGYGNCTHVWNYETATAFLFGDLAKSMRDVEFSYATDSSGMMNIRVGLPLSKGNGSKLAAADGQMGCLIKLYREWQLSGDDEFLKRLYPSAKSALEFVWISGGWDADQDGVMEGIQHNTMDVEYCGPNPQMTIYYLGALRSMAGISDYLGDVQFAAKCKKLFDSGSKWTDQNLFNGEYYIQKIKILGKEYQRPELILGNRGAWENNFSNPIYQLGEGCLVDQLVGQYLSHTAGLGYLVKKEHIAKTLQSILKYNYRANLSDHFNCNRGFALGNEAGLLMVHYPKDRPAQPFPYFSEVMTGFEYAAAVGMLQEGQTENGLKCIRTTRSRYDGRKRNPFNEAEYGNHYGRAMASWSAVLALTGFQYSGVTKEMKFKDVTGECFWSNGYAYGTVDISKKENDRIVTLCVLNGKIDISKITIEGFGSATIEKVVVPGRKEILKIKTGV